MALKIAQNGAVFRTVGQHLSSLPCRCRMLTNSSLERRCMSRHSAQVLGWSAMDTIACCARVYKHRTHSNSTSRNTLRLLFRSHGLSLHPDAKQYEHRRMNTTAAKRNPIVPLHIFHASCTCLLATLTSTLPPVHARQAPHRLEPCDGLRRLVD